MQFFEGDFAVRQRREHHAPAFRAEITSQVMCRHSFAGVHFERLM
jgi:hypothetical protein